MHPILKYSLLGAAAVGAGFLGYKTYQWATAPSQEVPAGFSETRVTLGELDVGAKAQQTYDQYSGLNLTQEAQVDLYNRLMDALDELDPAGTADIDPRVAVPATPVSPGQPVQESVVRSLSNDFFSQAVLKALSGKYPGIDWAGVLSGAQLQVAEDTVRLAFVIVSSQLGEFVPVDQDPAVTVIPGARVAECPPVANAIHPGLMWDTQKMELERESMVDENLIETLIEYAAPLKATEATAQMTPFGRLLGAVNFYNIEAYEPEPGLTPPLAVGESFLNREMINGVLGDDMALRGSFVADAFGLVMLEWVSIAQVLIYNQYAASGGVYGLPGGEEARDPNVPENMIRAFGPANVPNLVTLLANHLFPQQTVGGMPACDWTNKAKYTPIMKAVWEDLEKINALAFMVVSAALDRSDNAVTTAPRALPAADDVPAMAIAPRAPRVLPLSGATI